MRLWQRSQAKDLTRNGRHQRRVASGAVENWLRIRPENKMLTFPSYPVSATFVR